MDEIDWAELIKKLEGDGMPLKEIGERIGLAGSSVGDIKHGRSMAPSGTPAVRLFLLSKRNARRREAAQ